MPNNWFASRRNTGKKIIIYVYILQTKASDNSYRGTDYQDERHIKIINIITASLL